MTVNEFFESKEKLAIHCDTEEKAKTLLKVFDDDGYRWVEENRYTDESYWYVFKEDTCYSNECLYCRIGFYQEMHYKIIEFEEIEI